MTLSAPALEKILQAVNEKYGTSFEGWSQIPTAYEVGDTVPNWSAYEKIELPTPPIPIGNYLVYDIDRGSLFEIAEDGIYVYAQSNERAYLIQTDGQVLDTIQISEVSGSAFLGFLNSLNEVLGTSYEISELQRIIIPSLVGQNIKNTVESYELIEVT